MPLPFASDLAIIMDLNEFAVSAQYQRKSGLGDAVISVIFDNETVPVDAGGFATVHQEQPRVTCRTSDVPYISETDLMVIAGVGYVVRAWIHDGTGITEVRLEKE